MMLDKDKRSSKSTRQQHMPSGSTNALYLLLSSSDCFVFCLSRLNFSVLAENGKAQRSFRLTPVLEF